jgi:adenylate kinase family enzyme
MNISLEIKQIQKDLELISDENLINSIKSIVAFAKEQKSSFVFQPFSIREY